MKGAIEFVISLVLILGAGAAGVKTDSESDAVIYNLYSDICSRRLGTQDLRNILKYFSVTNEQVDTILMMASRVPENDPVEKIYINLAADTDPDYYMKFGRRTLPTYNTFQTALDLYQDNRIDIEGIHKIAQDMIYNFSFTSEELLRSFDELIRRQVLGETAATRLIQYFREKELCPASYHPSIQPSKENRVEEGRVYSLEGHFEPWIPERIDYIHDYR